MRCNSEGLLRPIFHFLCHGKAARYLYNTILLIIVFKSSSTTRSLEGSTNSVTLINLVLEEVYQTPIIWCIKGSLNFNLILVQKNNQVLFIFFFFSKLNQTLKFRFFDKWVVLMHIKLFSSFLFGGGISFLKLMPSPSVDTKFVFESHTYT